MTMRWSLPVSFQAVSTSASGTCRASIWKDPLVISAARPGSSARMSRVGTEPCPLPTICSRAARSAADGIAATGPATEPISIQVSDRAVRRGLVRRDPSSDDGRAVRLSLTPAGQHLASLGAEEVAALIAPMTGSLTPADQKRLGILLDRTLPKAGLSQREAAGRGPDGV